MGKDMVLELNNSRLKDIQNLSLAVEQRTTKVSMDHLSKQVELLSDMMGTKACATRLDKQDAIISELRNDMDGRLCSQRDELANVHQAMQAISHTSALDTAKSLELL